jgi:hypothetical protein
VFQRTATRGALQLGFQLVVADATSIWCLLCRADLRGSFMSLRRTVVTTLYLTG